MRVRFVVHRIQLLERPRDSKEELLERRAMLSFADRVNLKTDLTQFALIEQIAAVKQEGRSMHLCVDLFKIERFKFVPLGEDGHRMGIIRRLIAVIDDGHAGYQDRPAAGRWSAANV